MRFRLFDIPAEALYRAQELCPPQDAEDFKFWMNEEDAGRLVQFAIHTDADGQTHGFYSIMFTDARGFPTAGFLIPTEDRPASLVR